VARARAVSWARLRCAYLRALLPFKLTGAGPIAAAEGSKLIEFEFTFAWARSKSLTGRGQRARSRL
jgi:hypothetical protein